jgi:hypothetical protein
MTTKATALKGPYDLFVEPHLGSNWLVSTRSKGKREKATGESHNKNYS